MGSIFGPLLVKPFLNAGNNETSINTTTIPTLEIMNSNSMLANVTDNTVDAFENKLPLPCGIIGVFLAIIGVWSFVLYFYGRNKSKESSNFKESDSDKSLVSRFNKREEWYIVFWGALAVGFYVGLEYNTFQFLATYTVNVLPESEYTKTERTLIGANLSAGLGTFNYLDLGN